MQTQSSRAGHAARAQSYFQLALILALGLVALRAIVAIVHGNGMEGASNDDLMRMMSVRSWLAGQAWFDMTQYRVLPDAGVSLHWSRYVDAGIAAIVWPISLVLPYSTAENVAAVLWPATLSAALICAVAFGARRLMGPMGAAIATATIITYPTFFSGYFAIGRFDHHSVQILLMVIACLSIALPDRPRRRGIIAGFAAGLSLAVSLETMFLIAALGAAHVVDHAFGREGSAKRLAGFCGMLSVSAVIMFLGQTPPAEWAVLYCDELALPFLTIACIGSAAGLASLLVPDDRKRPWMVLGIVAAVSGLGLALSWSLVGGCVQSPYGNLPEDTQHFIATAIAEALPLVAFAQQMPQAAINNFAVAGVATLGATVLYIWQLRAPDGTPPGLGHLLAFAWIGLLASLWQVRQVVILAGLVPFLVGYLVQFFVALRLRRPTALTQGAMYAAFALTLFQPVLITGVSEVQAAVPRAKDDTEAGVWSAFDAACSDLETLSHLNAVAPGPILTNLNLGPALIFATHHAALSAPYHRSNAAIVNGKAFELTEEPAFRAALDRIGTNRFLVCQDGSYGDDTSMGSRLAAGEAIAGYDRIDVGAPALMLFEVADPS